jgi:hypothetical protein
VKVSALVTAALAALLIGGMLLAGGDHGPGRHLGAPVTCPVVAATTQA